LIRLAVILLLALLLPQMVSAKRLPSVKVDAMPYEGIRYVVLLVRRAIRKRVDLLEWQTVSLATAG
jgi:hypothetical protein